MAGVRRHATTATSTAATRAGDRFQFHPQLDANAALTESLESVRARVEALAARIGAPANLLPTWGRTEDFARPHVEVDDRYHFVVVERGEELERISTRDLGELLYQVFQSVTFTLAWDHELAHRRPGPDPRRLAFRRQEELMAALEPAWGQWLAAEHAATLAEHPFADQGPVDRTPPDRAWSPVLSVILPARHAAPNLAALMRVLVPGAVDGLVREVIVADPAPDADVAALCEDAGAVLVRGGLAEAAGRAKSDRVLVVPPNLRLPDAWMRRLGEALAVGAKAGLLAGEGDPGLLAAFRPRPTAILAPKADAAASPDLPALRRRLGAGAKRL